jgi:hypothetical protein
MYVQNVFLIQEVLAKANRSSVSKMNNDLMHGMFTTEYMARHSLAGGNKEKDALPTSIVDHILCE